MRLQGQPRILQGSYSCHCAIVLTTNNLQLKGYLRIYFTLHLLLCNKAKALELGFFFFCMLITYYNGIAIFVAAKFSGSSA